MAKLKVDGKETVQFTDEERRFRSGWIGLQVWGKATEVSFRQIQVRRLSVPASSHDTAESRKD